MLGGAEGAYWRAVCVKLVPVLPRRWIGFVVWEVLGFPSSHGEIGSETDLRLVKNSAYAIEEPQREDFPLEYFYLQFFLPGCPGNYNFIFVPY
jgi:hypothetical protein